MTEATRSELAVERTYLLVRHAGGLLQRGQGAELDAEARFAIASLQLETLALVEQHHQPPVEFPVALAETIIAATEETLLWDVAALPASAAGVVLALFELRCSLAPVPEATS